jgi:integrase
MDLSPDPADPRPAEDRKPALIARQPAPLSAAETDRLRGYLDASQADSTRRGYRSDLAHFTAWCEVRAIAALPAEPATVARYLADLAEQGYKVATLERRIAAISQAHQAREFDTPTRSLAVRKVFAGIRRAHGVAQAAKAPVLPDDLRAMLAHLDDSLSGRRDRALLLLGFAGAFRRSELVGLTVEDLERRRDGLVVTLRRSKTDQEGQGTRKGIPRGRDKALCPVRAVEAWQAAAGIADGPLFRPIDRHGNVGAAALAPHHVARLVKRLAAACGLDPDAYGGHSLRAGLVTAAAQAGAEERDIMRQTGHRSERTVRRYIREANLFRGNAADGLL